ncbi:hypothetical protein QA634_14700 [Methylobacterium sp. CB376]|uniref:hypothetical protein n=1 Tax=Methylobacterium sp. CB376 TaxID=3138063 RepID=UPI0005BE67DA|nr:MULTISPECIES: hypothetical protein [Methylobacterium]WFT83000.1 hypothetical protein QA634_14700 [Methylobacterium nodulans]
MNRWAVCGDCVRQAGRASRIAVLITMHRAIEGGIVQHVPGDFAVRHGRGNVDRHALRDQAHAGRGIVQVLPHGGIELLVGDGLEGRERFEV